LRTYAPEIFRNNQSLQCGHRKPAASATKSSLLVLNTKSPKNITGKAHATEGTRNITSFGSWTLFLASSG
jgi:hypothetical protein